MKIDHDKLVCFIYILGRDHLPLGIIERIIGDVDKEDMGNDYVYSNAGLEEYANSVAKRLLNEG